MVSYHPGTGIYGSASGKLGTLWNNTMSCGNEHIVIWQRHGRQCKALIVSAEW